MKGTPDRWLALLAAALGLAALLFGDGPPRDQGIDAVALAEIIRDRRAGFRLIDLRSRQEFAEYRIPGAVNRRADELVPSAFAPDETVVLYAATTEEAERVRGRLAATHARVTVLRGGLEQWLADIMNPEIPLDPTPEQHHAYERKRALAEYFGGQPAPAEPDLPGPSLQESLKRLKRRGC